MAAGPPLRWRVDVALQLPSRQRIAGGDLMPSKLWADAKTPKNPNTADNPRGSN